MKISLKPRVRLYVGIDIGKSRLSISAGGLTLNVTNNRAGWEKMLTETGRLKRQLHFVCEAAGHFGAGLVSFLFSRKKRLSIVSPYRIKQFGKAIGRLAKTDPIDADLIAEYGQTLQPEVSERPAKTAVELRSVTRGRRQLLREKGVLENELRSVDHRLVCQSLLYVIAVMDEQMKFLDQQAELTISRDEILAAKHLAFCEVKGIGALTSRHILAGFPEIGRVSGRRAAALIGLAPYNDDSGQTKGGRHIWGGRSDVRLALYMPSVLAIKFNAVLGPFYRRLRARGKPHRIAITAVMRKLLVYLNSIAAKVERKLAAPPAEPKQTLRGESKRALDDSTKARLTIGRRTRASRLA